VDDIGTKQISRVKDTLSQQADYFLKNIDIENYAIIKKSSLGFGKGLNVIVGETGTGKSLLIKALYSLFSGSVSPLDFRIGSDSISIRAEMHEDGVSKDFERSFTTSGRGKTSILGKKASNRDLRDMLRGRWIFLKQHAFTQLMSM